MQSIVEKIVLSDQRNLKDEKISEWEQGLIIDGVEKREYRSADYAIFKSQINPLAKGHVDLLLSRQTARTLFVRKGLTDSGFTFGMQDYHNLLDKYGNGILGLNQDWFVNRQKEVYLNKLIQEIKQNYKIG